MLCALHLKMCQYAKMAMTSSETYHNSPGKMSSQLRQSFVIISPEYFSAAKNWRKIWRRWFIMKKYFPEPPLRREAWAARTAEGEISSLAAELFMGYAEVNKIFMSWVKLWEIKKINCELDELFSLLYFLYQF